MRAQAGTQTNADVRVWLTRYAEGRGVKKLYARRGRFARGASACTGAALTGELIAAFVVEVSVKAGVAWQLLKCSFFLPWLMYKA